MKFEFTIREKKMLADIISPVSLFLRFRDEYVNTLLLESSDYHGAENSMSFICLQPIASFQVERGDAASMFPDGSASVTNLSSKDDYVQALAQFLDCFSVPASSNAPTGVFGYMKFDAVQYVEDIKFREKAGPEEVPEVKYQFFQYVIAIDHFRNELTLYEFNSVSDEGSEFDRITDIIQSFDVPSFPFEISGKERSNFTDEEFLEVLEKGKHHCQIGDVFQIVLSRRFERPFKGDEFNVYRALRSINPSPYLYYFDYGNFKIFGSSPEAQIVIKDGKATIFPIAGTFKRTGADEEDRERAKALANDPKENSEHIMLVDLARNDLSRHGDDVKVTTFKEIQFYSHVIHLVSQVTATLKQDASPLKMIGDTFPAGTLSGAPKFRAMELIDELEPTKRGYYGGAIGFLGLNGDFNHAIMIRSFFSKDNRLTYQAGAGVVAKSVAESELQEVTNKLGALRSAMEKAEEL